MKVTCRGIRGLVAALFAFGLIALASDLPRPKPPPPTFAIYTLAEPIDKGILIRGTGDWSRVTLSSAPVITDADILNYDFTTHTMRLRRETIARLPRPPVSGTPFIVTAEGKRIYLGAFVTGSSSYSFAVPSIVADARVRANQPADSVVIERGYPTAGFGVGTDPRADARIRAALEKRLSLATEVDVEELSSALRKVLPRGWSLECQRDAQPYGLEPSFIHGAAFVLTGPHKVKGPKGEIVNETICIVVMPKEYRGNILENGEAGPAGRPSRFIDWTVERKEWLKVYCDSATETPTWPGWETDIKRALGISLTPVSIATTDPFEHLKLTTNDVVLVRRADDRKAAIQFTSFGVKTATYRWRYRAAGSNKILSGTGAVFEKEAYDKSPEALALPKHDCSVRAGNVHLGWSYGGTNFGYLYFYPSRQRVHLFDAEAFERLP